MHQNNMGFLEHLYRGTLRTDLYNTNFVSADEKKIATFIEKYQKVISVYPPLELEKLGTIPDDLMAGLKDIGIFGLTIPTKYGGLGFTPTEYLRTVEEMSRTDMALVLVPLAHLSIGIKGVMLFGNEWQKQTYLTKAASGEMVFAYTLTEPKKGSDAQHIDTVATLSEDESYYTLNGEKTYITNGNYAGGFTVFAQLDTDKQGRMGAFIVEKSWDGVSVGKDMPKMGLKVSSTTPIRFRDVKIPKENLIGNEGDGFKIAMNVLNYGRLALGAAAAGGMKQSIRDMLNRSRKRVQFGVPIKSFELIQEKMVRAHAHAFATSAMTYFTANLLEKEPLMNVAIESSHCKMYGTNQCWNTLYDALQTAGGAGYISTLPYEKRMRDSRVTTIFEGTTEIHSIYAPLTLFRDYAKALKGQNTISKLMYIHNLASKRLLKQIHSSHPQLQQALEVAGKSEAIFRKLASKGIVKYRKEVVNKEFFLRRMTELSLSLFMLVASVAYLESTGTSQESDILSLQYLVEEAKKTQKECNFVEPNTLEKIHHKIFSSIDEMTL